MRFQIIANAYNSLPFVKTVDADSLQAVTSDIDQLGGAFIPMFVVDFEDSKTYRVVVVDGDVFLSDDASELLGPATEPEYFKRLGGPQTMETDE
jgi:hypothetical protein